MKWIALLLALVCCTLLLPSAANAQQCFDGSCYNQPVFYAGPVYQPAPVIVFQRPLAPNSETSPGDTGGVPLEQTVIVTTPDPRLQHCSPHGCFRPQFEPRPFYGPHCPPAHSGFAQQKRSIGIGLNLSWNSRRSWRY